MIPKAGVFRRFDKTLLLQINFLISIIILLVSLSIIWWLLCNKLVWSLLPIGLNVVPLVQKYWYSRFDWKAPPDTIPYKHSKIRTYLYKNLYFFMKFEDWIFYLPVYWAYCIDKGWKRAQNYPQFKSDNEHDAIVVVHEKFAKKCFYGDGIDLLIDFFKEQDIPYKLYHCYNLDTFEMIVRNANAVNLWLFGHGRRGGIACGNQSVEYEKFKNANPKRYIYQFHCNPGTETSLAEYLSNGRGYVSNRVNHPVENREHIKQILNDWCKIHDWKPYQSPFF